MQGVAWGDGMVGVAAGFSARVASIAGNFAGREVASKRRGNGGPGNNKDMAEGSGADSIRGRVGCAAEMAAWDASAAVMGLTEVCRKDVEGFKSRILGFSCSNKRQARSHHGQPTMTSAVASPWHQRRRRVFQSVFQTDVSQPTPQTTPCVRFPDQGHVFGGPPPQTGLASGPLFSQQATQDLLAHAHAPVELSTSSQSTIPAPSQSNLHPPPPLFPPLSRLDNQQAAFDRAWHVVTARIALPPSATADDSFGTLPTDSQLQLASQHAAGASEDDFAQALALLVHHSDLLPDATQTDDIVAWHAQQVRAHFAQHVMPLLSGCLDDGGEEVLAAPEGQQQRGPGRKGNYYERHMFIAMSSIRTLQAALRLYFYGLGLLVQGFGRLVDGSTSKESADEVEELAVRFRRDTHALVGNSASDGLMRSVRIVLVRLIATILGVPWAEDGGSAPTQQRPAPPTDDDLRVLAARHRLHEFVEQLHNVGLAGERFQVLFAEIMDTMMSRFVKGAYAGVWAPDYFGFSSTPDTIPQPSASPTTSACLVSLGDWVENHFARLSLEVLSRICPEAASPVPLSDVKTYQSLASGRLAALRIDELFDIVLAWPMSRGALDDLRATITTSARRRQLTTNFSRTLRTRLLHPGRSTLEILRTYISIIRTFHTLDNSKVLLGHIEPDLQLYLCQREDAIRVVITGMLASPEELQAVRKVKDVARMKKANRDKGADAGAFVTPSAGGALKTPTMGRRRGATPELASTGYSTAPDMADQLPSSTLVELALILNDPAQTRRTAPEEEELDWNDMSWVPDPVDAGANYKRPRSEDVIGTLISALGSPDIFIKEFSSVVAGRLLGGPARFDQELRVLDLLKRRFGEAALQNCDVMIRDIQDSRRVDATIIKTRGPTQAMETPVKTPAGKTEEPDDEEYHARILSRLFWPDLEREHFLLPQPIVEYQQWYERGYEELKSKRKLTWLNQLGQARVELELEDRTVTVDCSTVEATVIYAFQDPNTDGPVKKSADDLYTELQMDEDLISAALTFWAGKGVLRRGAQGVYAVIESLSAPNDDGTAGAVKGEAEASVAADEGAEMEAAKKQDGAAGLSAKEMERRAMYWQYVKGMLTNASASMPLAQVAMMMKMLVPDGFPWGNEELQEFLGEKVAAGEMEVVGGKYRLKK
ncbi:anaphase-promoting complex subunit 2 [Echria macrotheca]|uniref:Anaphase-promoting complex subunit 2 n=1 Tax=Echria macrotheca TaxID=438768 RepID=A0AAJ0BHU4_9PEZI|nr:anaphase-promoting complex subunit 2 [Echria macrotheca]